MTALEFGKGISVLRVGGAVRDELLDYPYDEVDWVVVGATPETLIDAGFKQVGSDFPVFLHPSTGEEYALARTERKSGRGYGGFIVHADPGVTLEEDLYRRDLTINAMARDAEGLLIDPYGGARDLSKKLLRHVSDRFTEDPLRVLRVCRFASRYHHLGFAVASETLELMRSIVSGGELRDLAPDRIWRETHRALGEKNPEIFFTLIAALGIEPGIYPFYFDDAAIGCLSSACNQHKDSLRRWAVLTGACKSEIEGPHRTTIPKRHDKVMKETRKLVGNAPESAQDMLQLLEELDAFRQGSVFPEVIDAINCIDSSFTPTVIDKLKSARALANVIGGADFAKRGLQGPAIKQALHDRRVEAIKTLF